MLASGLQALLNFIKTAVEAIILLLPESPFTNVPEIDWPVFLKWAGLFFPFSQMVIHLTTFLGAVLTWYMYRWIIRFGKLVS